MRTLRKIWLPIRREKITSVATKNSKNKNVSAIIGDSTIKDIEGWELSNESKVFVVIFFDGATTKDMESYIRSTMERAPSNVTLHCGTNDLKNIY